MFGIPNFEELTSQIPDLIEKAKDTMKYMIGKSDQVENRVAKIEASIDSISAALARVERYLGTAIADAVPKLENKDTQNGSADGNANSAG